MPNHTSFLDPFAISVASPRFTIGIEKEQNLKVPVYGWLVKWWGNIHIDRTNREKAINQLKAAAELLKNGEVITIAPEGTRSRTGELGEFKKGGFHMAIDGHADIIPITILGMREVNPDRRFRLRKGTVTIVFHPPISTENKSVSELMELVRTQIQCRLHTPLPIPLNNSKPNGYKVTNTPS